MHHQNIRQPAYGIYYDNQLSLRQEHGPRLSILLLIVIKRNIIIVLNSHLLLLTENISINTFLVKRSLSKKSH